MISINIDSKLVEKTFGDLANKNFAFATARSLTWTAKDSQKEVQRELHNNFTLRNYWVERGIRITPATKSTLQSEIGSVTDFMEMHETGDTKKPRGRHLAIPVEAKRSKKDIIRKPNRPRALLERPDTFIGKTKSGHDAVFQRLKGRRGLKLMYLLEPSAKIKKRFHLEKTVNKVVEQRFDRLFKLSMDEALK